MARDYSHLSRGDLERRLDVAEDALTMVGWTAAAGDTPRDKALHELWARWTELPGVDTNPAANPHLSDELVTRLAARRDETRAATLQRLTQPTAHTRATGVIH